MIKYYLNTGDQTSSDMFTPYVWGKHGLGTMIDSALIDKKYGPDLKLLLIQYYIEGKFSSYLPEVPKVSNYSKKNLDIAVAFAVTPDLFHNRNEFEKREFIVDSTINAIKLVQNKLLKKKLHIDFDILLSDIKSVSKSYLRYSKSLSDT